MKEGIAGSETEIATTSSKPATFPRQELWELISRRLSVLVDYLELKGPILQNMVMKDVATQFEYFRGRLSAEARQELIEHFADVPERLKNCKCDRVDRFKYAHDIQAVLDDLNNPSADEEWEDARYHELKLRDCFKFNFAGFNPFEGEWMCIQLPGVGAIRCLVGLEKAKYNGEDYSGKVLASFQPSPYCRILRRKC